MGEQGHDEGHGLCRSAQPIKHRAFGSAERLATLRTNEAPVFLRMDANVALADVASGRTRQIGAEYRGGVHDDSPLLVVLGSMPRKSMSGPPFPLQPHSTTVKCGATSQDGRPAAGNSRASTLGTRSPTSGTFCSPRPSGRWCVP